MCQGRCLLPAPLAVVVAPHRVGPPVAVSDLEPNPVLFEHMLERREVDTARVSQRSVDQVTQGLLEAARLELLSAEFPVGLRTLRVCIGFVPSFNEQLVVELAQTPSPTGIALQGFTCALVVVYHVDVSVHVPTLGVVVDDHEVLGAERGLGESNAQTEHLLEVLRPVHVEDLGVPGEHKVVGLVLAAVGSGHLLGVGDELFGRSHRRRIGSRAVGAALHVVDVLLSTAVERVHDTAAGRGATSDVDCRAHDRVRSPSSARRAVTATRIFSSKSSLTTTVTASPAWRAEAASRRRPLSVMPSRRNCPTVVELVQEDGSRPCTRLDAERLSPTPGGVELSTGHAHIEMGVERDPRGRTPRAGARCSGGFDAASRDLVRQLRFARVVQDLPALVLGRCASCGRGVR